MTACSRMGRGEIVHLRPAPVTFRLFAETLTIIVIVELAIMEMLGRIEWVSSDTLGETLLDGVLLAVLSGPLLLWRFQAASQRSKLHPDQDVAGELQGHSQYPTLIVSLIVLGMVVVGSFIAAQSIHKKEQELASARFDRLGVVLQAQIEARLVAYEYGIRGQAGLFKTDHSVDRNEFREFVRSRSLVVEFPGALGFGFLERVRRDELDAFVSAQQADGAPDFAVQSRGDQAELYVTKFIEPMEANREALGVDFAADPVHREAADRAMLTGKPALSGEVAFSQEPSGHTGFVYFYPVYANGSDPTTPEERRRELVGWVFLPLVPEEALAGVTGTVGDRVELELYSGPIMMPETLVFAENTALFDDADGSEPEDNESRMFHSQGVVTMGGREWTLWLGTTPAFEAEHELSVAMVVGIGGTLLGMLLAMVVWGIGSSRSRAVALAARMTADLQASEREARALVARHEALQLALNEQVVITVTDCAGVITEVNERFVQLSGYSREELLGSNHRILNSGHHPKSFWVDCWKTIVQGGVWQDEVCNRAKDGSLYWIKSSIGPMRDADGKVVAFVAVRVDITEQKRVEEKLHKAAYTDELTGLANRACIGDRLTEVLAERGDHPQSGLAVLFVDIDRFKFINDTMGHEVGDEILREIAERLSTAMATESPDDDSASENLVARIGSDEFVVLARGVEGQEDAAAVGERLLEVFAEPMHSGDRELFLTASIGVALGDSTTEKAEEILRHADIAMYEAKLAGRGRQVQFDASMSDRIEERLSLESDLRNALLEQQFFLTYQPIVSLETNRVEGFEALIRWHHPTRGLVRPDEFIPTAERTGLILPIGEWVLREACRQFAQWREQLGDLAPEHISVNLSRNQLVQDDLPKTIEQVLEEMGVDAFRLHLEITESAVMEDIASGTRMLNAIGAIGVKQSLDDFGTGHSSLASLHEFPVEVLKIDRSFVANIDRGRRFVALVHAAAQLASNLGMEVVAEGIEDADQLVVLQSLGCEFGQGYFFSKPMKAEEVPGFLASWSEKRRIAA